MDYSEEAESVICSHLDEGSHEEESMGEPNLDTAKERRDASAIGGESGKVACDDGSRSDWSFKEADEGVSVDGLNNLSLFDGCMSERCDEWKRLLQNARKWRVGSHATLHPIRRNRLCR